VDVVLSFEGDRYEAHRLVRAVKNRFGATMEVGLFEMSGTGLREVAEFTRPADPLAPPRPGSVIAPLLHGSRCLIVEIQALTAPGFLGNAKRKCSGLEGNRLSMLIAVLEQHVGLRLADQDVYASSAGGIRVVDPGSDLALALAVAGAFQRRAIQPGTAVVGEVGLGGEIRMTAQVEQRVREAQRLGYASVIGPLMRGSGLAAPSGYTAVRSIQEAVEQLGPAEKPPLRARRERPSQDATGREGSGVSISTQRAQRGDSG